MIKRKLASGILCKNCGKIFKPRMDLVKRGLGIFCSVYCSNIGRSVHLKISKEKLEKIYKKEGSIHKTAKALGIGWKVIYKTMKRLGVDTSGKSRLPSTYESCYNSEGKRVAKHKVVAEKFYGQKMKKGEVVHHIDGNRQNNNPENLAILTRSVHNKHHIQLQKIALRLLRNRMIIYKGDVGYTISQSLEGVLDGE